MRGRGSERVFVQTITTGRKGKPQGEKRKRFGWPLGGVSLIPRLPPNSQRAQEFQHGFLFAGFELLEFVSDVFGFPGMTENRVKKGD